MSQSLYIADVLVNCIPTFSHIFDNCIMLSYIVESVRQESISWSEVISFTYRVNTDKRMLDKIFYVANNLYTFKITTAHFTTCLTNRYMIQSFHWWGNLPYTRVSQNIVPHPAWISCTGIWSISGNVRNMNLQLKIQL